MTLATDVGHWMFDTWTREDAGQGWRRVQPPELDVGGSILEEA